MSEPVYPSLVDLPDARPVRRIYLGGYLPPIPRVGASDEQLLAFARACADPWSNAPRDYVEEWADNSEAECDREDAEGYVIFLPFFSGPDSVAWAEWAQPAELVERYMALRAAKKAA